MTNQPRQPASSGARRKPSLRRTVLSIVIAVLVAAWLPFSVLYINALSKHAAAVAKTVTVTQSARAGHAALSLAPVTTRTS
jgi:hypothetical protein